MIDPLSALTNASWTGVTPTDDNYRIGRNYCPACHRSWAYVKHYEVKEMRCPICDGPTVPAHQEDTDEHERREK